MCLKQGFPDHILYNGTLPLGSQRGYVKKGIYGLLSLKNTGLNTMEPAFLLKELSDLLTC